MTNASVPRITTGPLFKHPYSFILRYKLFHRIVHFLGMAERQKVLAALYLYHLRILTAGQHLDFLLRIRNTVHRITCPMEPQHRTLHIAQSTVQSISVTQVNRRHTRPLAAVVALVVALYGLDPEIASLRVAVLAETNVDEEVCVVGSGLEIWGRRGGGPFVDGAGASGDAIPAAEFAGSFALVVH